MSLNALLQLALACGLLALLSLPFGEALAAFFMQGFAFSLFAVVALALGDGLRWMGRAVAFFGRGAGTHTDRP